MHLPKVVMRPYTIAEEAIAPGGVVIARKGARLSPNEVGQGPILNSQ